MQAKKFLLLALILSLSSYTFSQRFDYEGEWNKIKQQREDGKDKSAFLSLQVYVEQAVRDKNTRELYKALGILDNVVDQSLSEKEDKHVFFGKLSEYAASVQAPVSSILYNYLAKTLQGNSWAYELQPWSGDFDIQLKIDGKTYKYSNLGYEENKETIRELFLKSTADPELTGKLKYGDYFKDSNEARNAAFTPSLQDIFVNDALFALIYQSDVSVYYDASFYDHKSFGPTAVFNPKHTNIILNLFESIEKLNYDKKEYYAYTDWRLRRLKFLMQNQSAEGQEARNEQFVQSLQEFKQVLNNHPAVLGVVNTEINFLQQQKENQYDWKINIAAKGKQEAYHEVLAEALKKYPSSLYAEETRFMIGKIEDRELQVSGESQAVPGTSSYLKLKYKNLEKVYLAVYHASATSNKGTENQYAFNSYNLTKKYGKELLLDQNGKYNLHSKDFLLPQWKETGKYFILIAPSLDSLERLLLMDEKELRSHSFAYTEIHVSALKAISQKKDNNVLIRVQNAMTGKPVQGAAVKISSTDKKGSTEVAVSDKDGFASFDLEKAANGAFANKKYFSYYWTAVHGKDSTNQSYDYYGGRNMEDQKTAGTISSMIITDRAIYRPGQRVYYKYYAYEGKQPDFKSVQGHKIQLGLRDQYDRELAKDSKITNEFGTCTGYFDLPSAGSMNGSYTITAGETSYGFLVEEYKRPTFAVSLDFEKKSYSEEEPVVLKGKINAYSGYGMANAKVHIRIEENPFFDYRMPVRRAVFTLDTNITADAAGNFEYTFIPEKDKENAWGRSFSFYVDATSGNGETQFASTFVFIGKKKDKLEGTVPGRIVLSESNKVVFSLKDDPSAKKQYDVRVYQLKKQSLKQKDFVKGEFLGFTGKEFQKAFPDGRLVSEQGSENDYTRLSTLTFTTGDSVDIAELTGGKSGDYKIEIQLVGDEETLTYKYVAIDLEASKGQHSSVLWVQAYKSQLKVGDVAKVIVASSVKKQSVFVQWFRGNDLIKSETLLLKGRKTLEYTVSNADLGGITVLATTIYNNTFYTDQSFINIPFTEKELKIELETKRDLLTPGGKEEWVFTVRPKEGNELDAELLALMTDKSLEQFASKYFNFNIYPTNSTGRAWYCNNCTAYYNTYFSVVDGWNGRGNFAGRESNIYYNQRSPMRREMMLQRGSGKGNGVQEESLMVGSAENFKSSVKDEAVPPISPDAAADNTSGGGSKPRTNFNETAFFYPQLRTDKDGKIKVSFTLPDALTEWKLELYAHDKQMRMGSLTKNFVAQKQLMVQPNAPRFVREGDELEFTASVVNMTENSMDTEVFLEWFNPMTNEVLPRYFNEIFSSDHGTMQKQKLVVEAGATGYVSWNIVIPKNTPSLVAYRIKVVAGDFSDSEEKAIPVLSNRVQAIESVPFALTGKGAYKFELPKVKKPSSTQQNIALTLEYNANPLWSVVSAIPVVMDDQNENTLTILNRYYINELSAAIIAQNPQLKSFFQSLATTNPEELVSALEKNPELKSIILSETPWLVNATTETAQKRRISLLFDPNYIESTRSAALNKLEELQNQDGGWSWYPNGKSNIYITQSVLSGLQKTGKRTEMTKSALDYLDAEFKKEYTKAKEENKLNNLGLSPEKISWLLLREKEERETNEISAFYVKILEKDWKKYSLQTQAVAGSYFKLKGKDKEAALILASLNDRKSYKEGIGTYWNENKQGYTWDRNTIETQVELIRFYQQMKVDTKVVSSMNMWLLNQKRGQTWGTTAATAEACHVLLAGQPVQLLTKSDVSIGVGTENISVQLNEVGAYKKVWTGKEIKSSYSELTIRKNDDVLNTGSLYLTYTDDISSVEKNSNGMKIEKSVFVVRNNKELPLNTVTDIVPGDRLRIRLQVVADRDLDFVHIKDLRAAGTEAVDVLSGYKYTGNVSFYQENHDASIDFFVDKLYRGTYHLDYDLVVGAKGRQSMGFASVECLYAPEFRANSKPVELLVR